MVTDATALKPIRSALISVYHKDGLEPIARALAAHGVTLYSTGGTQSFMENMGLEVTAVESLTDYPSILGGRVKTLHPKVFGGILGRRELEGDRDQMTQYSIPEIDLVIVDLYPFEDTVASSNVEQDIIEKIDIGGISLIRAAAKNFKDVVVCASRNDYSDLLDMIMEGEGSTSLHQRREMARRAFAVSSHYDTAIQSWFAGDQDSEELPSTLDVKHTNSRSLRYGENPHQRARFYGDFDRVFDQLHGKTLSYNNLVDVDAAVELMNDFRDGDPCFAILKHTNACGLAIRPTLLEAYEAALAGDPVSAFGGILISNQTIDLATAHKIHELFCEVVIAPDFDDDALEVLKGKKNRIMLRQKVFDFGPTRFKSLLGGVILQDVDNKAETVADFTTATKVEPTEEEKHDLVFASRAAKHLKSNTIALAKNNQLIAIGTGQTSRVDALRQAITKAKHFGFELQGAVMASDAFFPFPDCVEIAHEAGITAVVQPGGSIRDKDSIAYCDEHGMAMVLTGTRHFKH